MKCKLLTVFLIGLLVFSSLNLALAAKVKCPTCHGTGKIACPTCDGTGYIGEAETVDCTHCDGTGEIEPKVAESSMSAYEQGRTTNVTAVFVNHEDVEVNGTVTATLEDHSVTSPETTFPPNKEVTLSIAIDYAPNYPMSYLISHIQTTVNADKISCPYCDGTGTITEGTPCTVCDGTGTIRCSDCGGTGYVEESALATLGGQSSLNVTLIAEVAGAVVAVVVIGLGSFFLLKKRRVSEKKLRRLSNGEFQSWVLKKLDGKPATSKDISLGIDGFSRLNEPISIKQSDSVGMVAIDGFAAALARNRARTGIMVAFGFSDDAIRGKVRARTNYHLDIQMMTVRELIESRRSSY